MESGAAAGPDPVAVLAATWHGPTGPHCGCVGLSVSALPGPALAVALALAPARRASRHRVAKPAMCPAELDA